MNPDKKQDYTKIDKIALDFGLTKTGKKGVYWSHSQSTKAIDLTASGDDIKSVAKNIINQLK